jgi:hypothetical protein
MWKDGIIIRLSCSQNMLFEQSTPTGGLRWSEITGLPHGKPYGDGGIRLIIDSDTLIEKLKKRWKKFRKKDPTTIKKLLDSLPN